MFEALVTMCMLAAATPEAPLPGETCRAAVLPGFAAETKAACERASRRVPRQPVAGAKEEGLPFCAPRPASVLTFSEVASGVFVHRGAVAEPDLANVGDVSNIAFIVGSRSIAVIDAGGSRKVGEEVYLAIRERSALPITHLILTHMHPDHVFGAEPLQEAGATILGQANLPRALADRAETYRANFARLIGGPAFLGTRAPVPDRVIAKQEVIDLGDRLLELRAWPSAHTATDLTVFDRTSGILFAGDLLFDRHTPALDGSLRGWLAVLSQLKGLPARGVVPGHGGPLLDWPQAAEPLERYLGVLEADTKRALDAGLALGPASEAIGRSEAGRWHLFDLFNPRNATAAYTELEWDP
ncbi:quinoprotein relay system zinc metallohydrolase 2 [Sinorhizobium psoraleae]|uniref:Quinoprotein relay system zinc metallohydrolase 2 n=1 Tax=Sinorhizobium psoraleae TaxID=520838 RepID=A0ABT4KAD5_9HYPH|nr:quinoprotein relay system zinc metallohydrolase 2 [Sinorhizobium psoraleae]MCZ4088923.1 quinoprotein relay system zinc metallohydrolase 2 [Sinorhizobium psoraleae]